MRIWLPGQAQKLFVINYLSMVIYHCCLEDRESCAVVITVCIDFPMTNER